MKLTIVAALLLASTAAFAKDFTVNDQDQQALQTVCDIAAQSPGLNRDVRAQVSAFCVAWEKRVTDAAKPEAKPEVKATPVPEKK